MTKILKAESNAPSYRPVSVPEDFFMEGNPHGKKIKEKIKKALPLNDWIRYTLQRIGNLYGLHAEKFILEAYMDVYPDSYGQHQLTYACVLYALGHSREEVLTLRNQANEKFENFIQNNDIRKFPADIRFDLNMIYKYQVKVTDLEFLDYCHKNFF